MTTTSSWQLSDASGSMVVRSNTHPAKGLVVQPFVWMAAVYLQNTTPQRHAAEFENFSTYWLRYCCH
jgi:hypothetical protein